MNRLSTTTTTTATTTDNSSNFVAGFRNVWLTCFGHCLDLAFSTCLALARVQRALGRCRTLVCAFSRSWKKQRNLRAKQALLGLKEQKLIGDVDTRWGSIYDMVKRILQQQQAVSAVLAEQ